jgi:hypothetical protein
LMNHESLGALPAQLMRRWAKASKDGKRALVALSSGQENAQGCLDEAVEALNVVCDDMVRWRERNKACASPVASLIEAYCHEASVRHQMSVAPANGDGAPAYLAVWKTEPFVNGPMGQRARKEMRLVREMEDLRDRVH